MESQARHANGRIIQGTVSGGESNIYAVLHETDAARKANDWDRSILFRVVPLGIREFNNLTSTFPHAGCGPAELWTFIKVGLKRKGASE